MGSRENLAESDVVESPYVFNIIIIIIYVHIWYIRDVTVRQIFRILLGLLVVIYNLFSGPRGVYPVPYLWRIYL